MLLTTMPGTLCWGQQGWETRTLDARSAARQLLPTEEIETLAQNGALVSN